MFPPLLITATHTLGTTASVQDSAQPSCLKCKQACLCVTNTTEWPWRVSVLKRISVSFIGRTNHLQILVSLDQSDLPPLRYVNPHSASFLTAVQATSQNWTSLFHISDTDVHAQLASDAVTDSLTASQPYGKLVLSTVLSRVHRWL